MKKQQKELSVVEENGEKTAVEKKMSIYDYEQKYVRKENAKLAKFLVRLFASLIGIFLFTCLFLISLRVYEFNQYVGYGVGAVCLLLFIIFYLAPIIKIMRTGYFVTNVNAETASKAQRHNKKLRRQIADKFIEVNAKVEGVGWYDSQKVGELAIAVHENDDKQIKQILTALYAKSVKKSARGIITKASLKSALFSAISQEKVLDAGLIAVVNLQMIKDIVFLYGFRPSDAKLAKIFFQVIANSFVAYGMGSLQIGNTVVKTMGDAVRGIPILGAIVSTLVDSSIQGMTNAALTAVIGYQTIHYLNKEYRLQDILDEVELESPEDFKQTCEELEEELKEFKKKGKKTATPVPA